MNVTCSTCYKEIEMSGLYEYEGKEMCSDCVSYQAYKHRDYFAERIEKEPIYQQCFLCKRVYGYVIEGEFNDAYCAACLGSQELPRGEAYRISLWSRYLDKQVKTYDDFYDTKRFK